MSRSSETSTPAVFDPRIRALISGRELSRPRESLLTPPPPTTGSDAIAASARARSLSGRGLRAAGGAGPDCLDFLLHSPREIRGAPARNPRGPPRASARARPRASRAPSPVSPTRGGPRRARARAPARTAAASRSRLPPPTPAPPAGARPLRGCLASGAGPIPAAPARARRRARGCARRVPDAAGSWGVPSTSSNSMAAQTASALAAAKFLSAEKCVVTSARPPRARYSSRNAIASALPSSGSVEPPISSIKARKPGPVSPQDRRERFHRRGERRAAGHDLLRVADLGADRPKDGHARRAGRRGAEGPTAPSAKRGPRSSARRSCRPRSARRRRAGAFPPGRSKSSGTTISRVRAGRGSGDSPRPGSAAGRGPGRAAGGGRPRASSFRPSESSGKASTRPLSELDLRFERVERRHLRDRVFEVVAGASTADRNRQQLLHLAPFLRREQRELVVGLDDVERLDENGLTRSGAVVHDARDARTRRREDREAVAVVAQDDDRVSQEVAALVEDAAEASGDLRAAAAQFRAGSRRSARGVVADRAVRVEEPARLPDQLDEPGHRVAPPDETRRLRLRERAPHGLRRARHGEDRNGNPPAPPLPPSRAEPRASARCLRRPRAAVVRCGRETPRPRTSRTGARARRARRRRGEVQDGTLSGRGAGEGSDEPEDEGEFESVDIPLAAGESFESRASTRLSSESFRSIFLRAWIILRLRLALGFS